MSDIKTDLPLIPLRDVVVFPGIVTTLFVGRPKSVEALNVAMSSNKKALGSPERAVIGIVAGTLSSSSNVICEAEICRLKTMGAPG